ncbi:hypothetical protein [Flaviaesturariibacter amylovorans]|uniref:hypothetical protein n=1 Tax=Flaviaesturariibacter amylovorans TaxID=1084520 RepID=UPI0031EDB9B4
MPKSVALLQGAVNDIRDLSKKLSASRPGKMHYLKTINDPVESVRFAPGVGINLDPGDCPEMDAELHLALYRVLPEQLTRIHKNAAASQVGIGLCMEVGELVLRIAGNEAGFNTGGRYKGTGLTNMQGRAQLSRDCSGQ